ncbi:hypothetical protein IAD21_05309 [Abditibacteriota bacterium]|nr:hypothetical protein IAD21_05309 [Abditibacteriota bacterium]
MVSHKDIPVVPYSLKSDAWIWAGFALPVVGCLAMLLFVLWSHQWGGLFVALPLLGGFAFVIASLVSRRITLSSESVQFATLFSRPRSIPYGDIQTIEIMIGGKTPHLILKTIHSPTSLRMGLAPFGNKEWSKFIQIVLEKASHVTLNSTAQKWQQGQFY